MATPSVAQSTDRRHQALREIRAAMAKADLPNGENVGRRETGAAFQRALSLLGWTLDRCAIELKRDRRQIGRWVSGEERVQIDTLWDCEEMRTHYLQALGERANCIVRIVIEIPHRRPA